MDYQARLQAIGQEYNALSAQLQQPLNRLSFLQGQIDIIVALQAEEEASKKLVAESAKKAADEAIKSNGSVGEIPAEMIPGTQSS